MGLNVVVLWFGRHRWEPFVTTYRCTRSEHDDTIVDTSHGEEPDATWTAGSPGSEELFADGKGVSDRNLYRLPTAIRVG